MRFTSSARPPSSRPPSQPAADQDHKSRLVQAMIMAVTERGYAETTIADVVRHARVSKRTFYEHFPDKETCFLAAYRAVANEFLGLIALAAARANGIAEQINAAARAYFEALEKRPAMARTFLLDIHAAGPGAVELRREIHQQFADLICRLVDNVGHELPGVQPLSHDMATALVGGVNELIMLALEDGRPERLKQVANTATTLIWAALLTLPEGSAIAEAVAKYTRGS